VRDCSEQEARVKGRGKGKMDEERAGIYRPARATSPRLQWFPGPTVSSLQGACFGVFFSCSLYPRPTLLVATKDSTAALEHIRSFVAYISTAGSPYRTPVGRQMRRPVFVMDGRMRAPFPSPCLVHRLVSRTPRNVRTRPRRFA
jgi:hypothetical protein